MSAAASRPAFRAPWTAGAKAYPQADTIAALADGMRRRRKPLTVHVAMAAVADQPCACCGLPMSGEYEVNRGEGDMHRDDEWAYADCDPRSKTFVLRHYYCAWGILLGDVMKLAQRYA